METQFSSPEVTGHEERHDGEVRLAAVVARQIVQLLDQIDSIDDLRAARAMARRSLLNAELECASRGIVAPAVRMVALMQQVH